MIKFKAKAWVCSVCMKPSDRARGTDGIWANECVTCYAKFLACIAKHKAKKNPMWFLGANKKAGNAEPAFDTDA